MFQIFSAPAFVQILARKSKFIMQTSSENIWITFTSQVAHGGENGHPANDADGGVDECQQENVAQDGAVELVVRGEGDDGAECDPDWIEHL